MRDRGRADPRSLCRADLHTRARLPGIPGRLQLTGCKPLRPPGVPGGFTLVEMLVVLMIIGLISAVLLTGFERVLDIRLRLAAFLDGVEAPVLVADWFRATVGGLVADPVRGAGPLRRPGAGNDRIVAGAAGGDGRGTDAHHLGSGFQRRDRTQRAALSQRQRSVDDRRLLARRCRRLALLRAGSRLPRHLAPRSGRGTTAAIGPSRCRKRRRCLADPRVAAERPRAVGDWRGQAMNRGGEEGFALVTTLWFLALLALVTVIIEGWIAASFEKATALRQRVNSDAALIGATDRLAFAMIKGGWSPRGLELAPRRATDNSAFAAFGAGRASDMPFVALDGRPYRLGSVVARLQDEGGLFDLGNPDRLPLERLLRLYGVPVSSAERMMDALIDDLKPSANPRGAVGGGPDYARAGLPAARHARFLTPWEPYRVAGWAEQSALWQGAAALPDTVTTGPVGAINVNTAPVAVLAAITGIDEREAARVVAARAVQPIADLKDLPGGPAAIAGTEDRPLGVQPANIIRLQLTVPDDPLAHILSLRLTPAGAAPYRIDYAIALPQSPASAPSVRARCPNCRPLRRRGSAAGRSTEKTSGGPDPKAYCRAAAAVLGAPGVVLPTLKFVAGLVPLIKPPAVVSMPVALLTIETLLRLTAAFAPEVATP